RLATASGISTSAAANTVSVLSSSSAVFTLSFSVSAGSNGRATISGTQLGYTIDSTSERAWTVADIQLFDPATPPPPVGAVWTVFLDGVGFEYTRKAVSGTSTPEPIANVAAGLADAINQGGGRFATMYTSATLKLSGTPHAGDVWTLTLTTGASATPLTASYPVLPTHSPANTANPLAALVDGPGHLPVAATADPPD